MYRNRSLITMILAGAFLTTSIVGTGCTRGPKYGAARKSKKKGCDCPHWNAVPKQEGRSGTWSMNDPGSRTGDLQRTADHDRHN
jgi:hypothetical protein